MSLFRSGFNAIPPVVKSLLIINGLCYVACLLFDQFYHIDLLRIVGLYNPMSELFQPFQIVTHFFFHSYQSASGGISLWHIFSNMFALWMFGSVLENYWGGKRFFIFYFTTAIGAAFIHEGINFYESYQLKSDIEMYLSNPGIAQLDDFAIKNGLLGKVYDINSFIKDWSLAGNMDAAYVEKSKKLLEEFYQLKLNIPTVGASGAVFGLLLAFGMLFPNTELMMIFLPIPIKAKYFVMMYGAWELYSGIANNPADNVAHFAHLGGMLFGFILIKFWNKTNRNSFY